MAAEHSAGAEQQSVSYWVPPGETDTTAFTALILLFVIIFVVLHLYARFDRYVEHHNEGTPLKTTIPTLLMIAFAYEIFPPLSHFSILLPLALIATAMARDFMLWFEPQKEHMLRGELEDVLIDELHNKGLGEHDHLGRRGEAANEPPPDEESRFSRALRALSALRGKAVAVLSPTETGSAQVEAKAVAGDESENGKSSAPEAETAKTEPAKPVAPKEGRDIK